MPAPYDPTLARRLILDEIFDLSLYRALRDLSQDKVAGLLDELIRIETKHVAFWQNFFDSRLTALDWPRRLKLHLIILACRLFGAPAIYLALEAIEVHGIRKYLSLWRMYKNQPLGAALKGILVDEFKHEDVIVSQVAERKINPERVRNIFLGLNDGLVEILGAVSGFFGAFGDTATVLIAGSTTAVAGALSMAAGAYVAIGSEREVKAMEDDKKRFLGEASASERFDEALITSGKGEQPLASSLVVGSSYLFGAIIPLLPIAFGAKSALFSLITAGTVITVMSMLLAFLSGMDVKRRILTNLVIIAAAVGITYAIGTMVKTMWGIAV